MGETILRYKAEPRPSQDVRFVVLRTGGNPNFVFYVDNNPPGHAVMVPVKCCPEEENFFDLAEVGTCPIRLRARCGDGTIRIVVLDKEFVRGGGSRWIEE